MDLLFEDRKQFLYDVENKVYLRRRLDPSLYLLAGVYSAVTPVRHWTDDVLVPKTHRCFRTPDCCSGESKEPKHENWIRTNVFRLSCRLKEEKKSFVGVTV
ncbi:hypothetical protein FQA47_016046 [Oryzias melastigma]|uniref:Uncharacterized protein n=1 Tax=Oryzias melastigma TaxID=30732 RepID=A0A834FNZ5_ORYME|nr:hypothetical protein FQA47_016046 [Oryzias melastigma]